MRLRHIGLNEIVRLGGVVTKCLPPSSRVASPASGSSSLSVGHWSVKIASGFLVLVLLVVVLELEMFDVVLSLFLDWDSEIPSTVD